MIGHRGIFLAVCGLLSGGLLGSGGAQAQQGVFMRDALSNIGLIEPERPPIAYRERAPLVMPPKLDGKALPTPHAGAPSAQWPKDPEERQRERAAVEARKPISRGAQGRVSDNNMTLSIDEMRGGRRADAQGRVEPGRPESDGASSSIWSPFDIFAKRDDKVEPTIAEPDRDTLTDPPNGYRKAPKKVVTVNSDPINDPSRERNESDPGVYARSRN